MQVSCQLGFRDIVSLLYDAEASQIIKVQKDCHHAFYLAAVNGHHLNICHILLDEANDDKDAVEDDYNKNEDNDGEDTNEDNVVRACVNKIKVDFSLLLMSACQRQDYAMAELLLDHCNEPTREIITASYRTFGYPLSYCALGVACELHDIKMISLLLNKCQDKPPFDALLISIGSGSYECVACVLKNGCDSLVNTRIHYFGAPIQLSSKLGLLSLIELLIENGAVASAYTGMTVMTGEAKSYFMQFQIKKCKLQSFG